LRNERARSSKLCDCTTRAGRPSIDGKWKRRKLFSQASVDGGRKTHLRIPADRRAGARMGVERRRESGEIYHSGLDMRVGGHAESTVGRRGARRVKEEGLTFSVSAFCTSSGTTTGARKSVPIGSASAIAGRGSGNHTRRRREQAERRRRLDGSSMDDSCFLPCLVGCGTIIRVTVIRAISKMTPRS
jgi:hypothetical protein